MTDNSIDPQEQVKFPSDMNPDSSDGEASAPVTENPATPESLPTEPEAEVNSADPSTAQESVPPPMIDEADSATDAPAKPTVAKPEVLVGKVTRVTSEEVQIILSDNRQGAVPLIEFAGQPLPHDGDEVSVIVEGDASDTDRVVLSKRHADELTFWESVCPGDVIEGVVTGMNKGGLDIDIGGARAFLPSSQVDTRRVKDISVLIGEHLECVVTQVDPVTRDLVVSRRKYIARERKEKRKQALAELKEDEIRTGTITNVMDYGAFIDLGGVDGLLHMTDMSWGRIRSPKEVVEKGQQIRVRILKINSQTGKVSLGLKQLKPNPWDGVEERYPKGKRLKAKIARLTDFGAFLELEEGIDALLPLSEMSWSRHLTNPAEIVSVGDDVEVEVLKVDQDKQRISVGMKQTQDNPWANVEEKYPANTKTKGKVLKTTDFGAFVEIAPGLEGLVHISELSDRRVKKVTDVVQENQEVEVRVIKIDVSDQRISLSMKSENVSPRHAEGGPEKARKKRKKPLRGGLSSHFEW